MDKDNKRLDELFNEASKVELEGSYEEAEEQIIQTTSQKNPSGFSGTNKLILGVSVLIALTLGTVIYNKEFGESDPQMHYAENKIVIPPKETMSEEDVEMEKNRFEESIKMDIINAENDTLFTAIEKNLASKIVEPYVFDSIPKGVEKVNPQENQTTKESNIKETVDSYVFPNLTPEEIEANNDQKEKMVKGFGKVKKKTLNYAYIPMGSRDFGEGTFTVPAFWIKSTEVSNLEYRTFLFDLLIQDRKEDFLLAKPDQQQWKDEFALKNRTLDDLVENYFSHSAYNRHPVVGVSRKGAEMYCEWFTLEYKKTNPYSALFRLPTDIEWRYAAAGVSKGDKYPIEQSSIAGAEEDLIDVDGVYLANYRAPKICRKEETDAGLVYFIKYDGYLWSRPKHATNYPPSEYGLYHMAGNISEMIYYEKDSMRPGTRGGNFESLLNELEINGPDHFKGRVTPSIRIGFRPVLSYDRRVVSSLPSFGSEENLDSIYCADKVKCSGIMPKKSSSVTMSFTVDKEGELTHVYEVESSKSKVPDWMFQEAKRVLVDMPKWQPASINGTLVSLGDVRLEVSFEKCLTQD